ncbi:MAG: hypothetical protein ACREQI_02215 [Candidatus Binataceae bacterium]
MTKFLCADTGFLRALYLTGDGRHTGARKLFDELFERGTNRLLVAWPVLYETLNSEMSQYQQADLLDREWRRLHKGKQIEYLDDRPYRADAFAEWRGEPERGRAHFRKLSLVDRVLRNLLWSANEPQQPKVHGLLTYDLKDFKDVCEQKQIKIFPRVSA